MAGECVFDKLATENPFGNRAELLHQKRKCSSNTKAVLIPLTTGLNYYTNVFVPLLHWVMS